MSVSAIRGTMSLSILSEQMTFDPLAAAERCRRYRLRILEISQRVPALHIGGAFSCVEIVDCIYNSLMKPDDIFVMSKGHAAILQYVVLEDRGVLSRDDLDAYCTRDGRLGVHPDRGTPGIVAATGSLGHGLGMAVGMALAERNSGLTVYVVLSDGELMEGSTWEAIVMASSLGLSNLVAVVDYNNLQSLERPSVTHPSLGVYRPLYRKFVEFSWEAWDVRGHDEQDIFKRVTNRFGHSPLMLVAHTTKGRGVRFMEDNPVWHYRSPSETEYDEAVRLVQG